MRYQGYNETASLSSAALSSYTEVILESLAVLHAAGLLLKQKRRSSSLIASFPFLMDMKVYIEWRCQMYQQTLGRLRGQSSHSVACQDHQQHFRPRKLGGDWGDSKCRQIVKLTTRYGRQIERPAHIQWEAALHTGSRRPHARQHPRQRGEDRLGKVHWIQRYWLMDLGGGVWVY